MPRRSPLLSLLLLFLFASFLYFYQYKSTMRPISFMRLASICGLTTKPLVDTCLVAADQVPVSSYQDASVGGLGGLFGGKEELTLLSLNIRYDNPLSAGGPSLPGPDLTNVPRLYQEYSWSSRRHAISDIILNSNPDIFFFQEVLHNQLQDLVYLLGEDYDWVGVGRDDGRNKGEAVPVFWRRDKFQLLDEKHGGVGKKGVQHFWLSLTPDTPASKSWDAALTRMCTHVALRPLSPASTTTGSTAISPYAPIHIFSTHYDHKGVIARAESSKLIRSRAKEARDLSKSITGQEPLILLAGDLNSPREEQGWQNLVRGHHGISLDAKQDLAEDLSFIDLQLAVPSRFGSPFNTTDFPQQRLTKRDSSSPLAGRAPLPPPPARPDIYQQKQHTPLFKAQTQHGRGILSSPFGPPSSFTDWGETRDRSTAEDRIDFIFLGDNQAQRGDEAPALGSSSWKIKTAGVLSNWNRGDGGFRVSDHRPVIARLRWE